MSDIDEFVRRSQRNPQRVAVSLALMRRLANAGKLEVAWISEEERAADRLRGPSKATTDGGGAEYQTSIGSDELQRALASPSRVTRSHAMVIEHLSARADGTRPLVRGRSW